MSPLTSKRKAGRPRLKIDGNLVAELAQAQLTDREIARICKCSVDTLTRHFADTIKENKLEGVGSMRRKLFVTGMGEGKGAITAMIFYLKNYGGMADNQRGEEIRHLEFCGIPVPGEFDQPGTVNKPN